MERGRRGWILSKQTFLYGTLVLVGAGFITKVLGFIYRIALSRIIGDEGMGLFQMAFPILIFTIVITTAGLPVAISKLVSEAEVKKEEDRIASILMVALFITVILSILITSLILLGSPLIANILLTDTRTVYSLLAMAPIIPIIAISSVFRGYFQGRQNMSPYAISTIIEQLTRIFTVLFLAHYLLPYGIEYAAAGAMIGMVIGELVGMVGLLHFFKRDAKRPPIRSLFKWKQIGAVSISSLKRSQATFYDLLRIALPVTGSRMVGSLSYAMEPIIVAQSLAMAGVATAASTALYGQLEGMAIPLVFFPAFITYSLSISLVPAISEAAAQKKMRLVEHRLQQALRLCLITGAPCAVLMFMLAEPLSILLYHRVEVARLMQIMAPFAILFYLQGPLAAVLQGVDQAQAAMRNSIIGAVIKTGLIFLLASRPQLGIDGVALAINCGIVIVTVLHFISTMDAIPFTFPRRELGKLGLTIIAMGLTAHYLLTQAQIPLLTRTLLAFVGSSGIYLFSLPLLSLIRKEDIERVPYAGKWISHLLPR
jgi:stage V sporulation protein B